MGTNLGFHQEKKILLEIGVIRPYFHAESFWVCIEEAKVIVRFSGHNERSNYLILLKLEMVPRIAQIWDPDLDG